MYRKSKVLSIKYGELKYGVLEKYKCYWIGYVELSEKVTVQKKYLLLKKFFFEKSSCSEEVPAFENCIFWISIYSKEKCSSETVVEKVLLKKYLSSRSSGLEKVITKKWLLERDSCSRQISI